MLMLPMPIDASSTAAAVEVIAANDVRGQVNK